MKLIRFPVPDISQNVSGTLAIAVSVGDTAIEIANANTLFAANQFLVIENVGSVSAEIVKISSILANVITLTEGLKFAHEIGAISTLTDYDKYKILESSDPDDVFTEISGSEALIPFNEYEILYQDESLRDSFFKISFVNTETVTEDEQPEIVDSSSLNHLYATLQDALSQNVIDLSEYTEKQILDMIEFATAQIIHYLRYDLAYQEVESERARTETGQNDLMLILTRVRPVQEILKDESDAPIDVLVEFGVDDIETVNADRFQIFKDRGFQVFAVNSIGVRHISRLTSLYASEGALMAPTGLYDIGRTSRRDSTVVVDEDPYAIISYIGGYRTIPQGIKTSLFYLLKNNIDIQLTDSSAAQGIKKRKIQKREIEYFGGKDAQIMAEAPTKLEAEAYKILSEYRHIW